MSNLPPTLPQGKLKPFLPSERIQEMTRELGRQITDAYRARVEAGGELLLVVTLKGAIFFAADLIRFIDLPLKVDFVRLASYGKGTRSSGTVRILKDIEVSPQGRHVIVLDEIVDSGRTLHFLVDRLRVTGPKSLEVCCLLSKPSRREVEVDVAFLGTEVEDKFLIGYGLDYGENYRNLRDVYYLEES